MHYLQSAFRAIFVREREIAMKYNVNWDLFHQTKHGPAFVELENSSGKKEMHDFSVPVNPYFMTGEILEDFYSQLPRFLKYYPSSNASIAKKLGDFLQLDPEMLVMANGSTELITWIDHLFLKESLLTPVPTFGRWTDQSFSTGKRVETYQREQRNDFKIDLDAFIRRVFETRVRSVVICNPNNPTGQMLNREELTYLLKALTHLDLFIVDESFLDFSLTDEVPTLSPITSLHPNLVVLKSLGKSLGLHGVRLGYAVAAPQLQRRLRAALPPWNVNGVGVLLMDLLLKYQQQYQESLYRTVIDRLNFEKKMSEQSALRFYPSYGNFIFAEARSPDEGMVLRNRLLEDHGILIRECSNKIGSTSQYLRIASRPEGEQLYFMKALKDTFRSLAFNIEMQSAHSNVAKSSLKRSVSNGVLT